MGKIKKKCNEFDDVYSILCNVFDNNFVKKCNEFDDVYCVLCNVFDNKDIKKAEKSDFSVFQMSDYVLNVFKIAEINQICEEYFKFATFFP